MMEAEISFTEVDLKQEKFEDVQEEVKKFGCDLCDKEMVHNMALVLLEGLSTVCVDNTTGDMFKSPGTVAAELRKEMLDYLIERSESFVAEAFLSEDGPEGEKSDQPSDIISDFIEDFAGLKRNLLSRVSGWLLSDMREEKIEDFVQEMELNSFWLLDKREAIAQTLLKNVDFKNTFHCNMKFKFEDELKQHRPRCGFRTMLCENEGCCVTFSAAQMEHHDSICPFKILPCEQNCPEILMRREMDRHCITVCPMKLVNCPFYSIGCQARVPSCNIKEHCLAGVRSHLLYALQYHHKEASAEDLKPRADQIEQEYFDRLAGMQGVRSFTNTVKDLDSKLGPFEVVAKDSGNAKESKDSNSEEPPLKDTNQLYSEQSPTETTTELEHPLTEETKSELERPAEYTNNLDSTCLQQKTENTDRSQPAAIDSKESDSKHRLSEDQNNSDSEVSLEEDFKKVDL
ncbi:uncharacterized protein LOC130816049 [Amaranthus tricolor]|uniref:uncharacterized protein LOC130816049 n=1 Tax=Amaranthus tricolor TaxID=29722 RepID=UPI002586FE38|nr:uncharacterized protein LOC130816049 [Amaranthus tricolor]XP_057538603.1 uncharacterized protein LOC130816049 [Amaranthus tricolor]